MNTLIVGSSGFLGAALRSCLWARDITADSMDRGRLDLAGPIPGELAEHFRARGYRYVVICAAMADVERCFHEPALSRRVNVTGTIELLRQVALSGAIPVFFSTDYVFAKRPVLHREDDPREPGTLYGRQKLEVETFLEANFERFLIFRTSKLISLSATPKNLLFRVIRDLAESRPVSAFEDQLLNPVFVEDVGKVLEESFRRGLSGTYHLGSLRVFSRLELARFLALSLGFDPEAVLSGRMADFGFSEDRPTHNTLDCGKIERALGFHFTEVEEAIGNLRSLAARTWH